MATKLRKFSYSVFVKIIIFLVTAGCITFAGRAMFKIAVTDIMFNRDYGVNYDYKENFLSSFAFTEMVRSDIDKINTYAKLYHGDEEYVKSGKAWADYEAEKQKEYLEEAEKKVNDKIKKYIGNYSKNYSNNEYAESQSDTSVSAASSQADPDEVVYTLDYAKSVLSEGTYNNLVEVIEDIRASANSSLQSHLQERKKNFITTFENLQNEINSFQTLKFVYDDGEVFVTNVDGLEKNSDRNYSNAFSSYLMTVLNDGMILNNNGIDRGITDQISLSCFSNGNISIGINTAAMDGNAGTISDKYTQAATEYNNIYSGFQSNLESLIIALVAAVAGLIYLMITAGRKDKDEPVEETAIDRCFHDLHFLISGLVIFLSLACFFDYISGTFYTNLELKPNNGFESINYLVISILFVLSVIFLEWFMSFARAVKAGTLIKHSLWFVVVKKIFDFLKALAVKIKKAFELGYHFKSFKKSVLWKILIFFAGNAVFFLLGFVGLSSQEFIVLMILCIIPSSIFNFIFISRSIKTIINIDKIFGEVKKTSQGDFDFTLDYSNMKEPVKGFAEDVENMQHGLKIAVEDAIKGERMKTELITNVSHDLKTPLTSIINYVDLLGRCDINDETAKEYIGVLSDKSAKLKKLIEDLVEASKASTGNLKINKIKMNLYELAVQAVGENEDVLAERGIEVRINTPRKQPVVLADNQKTWRIIDNLFSNVKKYSLKGSRAYITVDEKDGWGRFSIKNISEKALDISPDELTQRFVRGDASRSSEGSGLGLSIAKSLCELQGGKFSIEIDGDLFKATIELPLAPEDNEKSRDTILKKEPGVKYNYAGTNINAAFNLPPDVKISDEMAQQLRRRQLDASQNYGSAENK